MPRRSPFSVSAMALAAVVASFSTVPAGAAEGCGRSADGPRYAIDGGVALDRTTGLEWRRCALGASFADGKCEGEAVAVGLDRAEAGAKALGEGWRLPSADELWGLVDPACGRPAVDPALFPDLEVGDEGEGAAWTTTAVGLADLWYFVDLGAGFADGHTRSYSLSVRLVRERAAR